MVFSFNMYSFFLFSFYLPLDHGVSFQYVFLLFLFSFSLPLGHGVFIQYFLIGLSIYTRSPHLFLRQGQEEDKTGTQSPATEPSHRVQGRCQVKASECGQPFSFLR